MTGFRIGFSANSGTTGVTSQAFTVPTGTLATDTVWLLVVTATSTSGTAHTLNSTTGSGTLSVPTGGLSGTAMATLGAATLLSGTGHVAGDVLTIGCPASGITTGDGAVYDNTVTFDLCGTAMTSGSSSTQTVPAVTTTVNGSLVVAFCAGIHTASRNMSSVSPGTLETSLNAAGGNTRWSAFGISDQTITTAGSSGTTAFVFSGAISQSAGIQVALKPAGGAFTGTAARATTASVTSAGVVGTTTTASLAPSAGITTTGVVGASSAASSTATVGTTATGAVGTSTTASLTATVAIAAAGTVGTPGSLSGTASQTATVGITSTGVVGDVTSASLTATVGRTAAGVVGASNTASLAATVSITAAGLVSGPTSSTATVTASVSVAASGVVGLSTDATLTVTTTLSSDGTAAQPSFRYTPPLWRDRSAYPLRFYVDKCTTVYRIGGVWHNVLTPGIDQPHVSACDVTSTGLLCYFNTPVNVPFEIHDALLAIVPADPSWTLGTLTPL